MNKEYIFTGKTIDDAINAGCSELKVDRDNVTVEVIETPSKSFLGLISTNAKVKLIISEPDGAADICKNFLHEVLNIMQVDAEIETKTAEDGVNIELKGEKMGIVIGRRGETLDALQYLTSLVVNKNSSEYVKVAIDTENYRQKREDSLSALAKKVAARVEKYKKSVTLEPMNPYERRIIHSTLQDSKNITTSSVGVDPNRRVVVKYNGPDFPKKFKRQPNR
ncbi:MAG: RNA-binding cell elongation regulator Jag/EloR [Bacillota bacterium]|nr:RNA-binding cell elongation regulator Jag/EloR [Bacillota bacterium]